MFTTAVVFGWIEVINFTDKRKNMKWICALALGLFCARVSGQTNLSTYLGNDGNETLYDVLQLSDGSILAVGYTDHLDWLPVDVSPQDHKQGALCHRSMKLQW